MTFTLEKLRDSIAGVLKKNYPDIPVYGNPNQQGTKTPCFFVFFMPSDMEREIDRRALAAKAFVSPAETRKLNRITLPRIEEAFTDRVAELEAEGHKAVVVEHSVFKNRQTSLAYDADVVIAVLAPIDLRIERAVKSGWDETDVRRRIAQQITDADRIEASDVVFNNDGTPEEMRNKVLAWWGEYSKDL